jgi:hypothetical protein
VVEETKHRDLRSLARIAAEILFAAMQVGIEVRWAAKRLERKAGNSFKKNMRLASLGVTRGGYACCQPCATSLCRLPPRVMMTAPASGSVM